MPTLRFGGIISKKAKLFADRNCQNISHNHSHNRLSLQLFRMNIRTGRKSEAVLGHYNTGGKILLSAGQPFAEKDKKKADTEKAAVKAHPLPYPPCQGTG